MASSAGIRAGKAYVEVGADLNPLEASLKTIQGKFNSFGSRIGGIGKGIGVIGAGAAALGTSILAPIAAATAKFADFGSTIKDTSDRTGISASVLSELGYAAEQSGTDLATVEKSISKLQKGITGAAGGSKSLTKSFDSLGLSATYLAKLSPQRQFEEVAAAVGKIQDPTARAAKAMEIFGKSGTQLLPLLTSDIEALRQEARDLGLSLSDIDASNAEGLGDAFDKVKKTLGGIALQIGAAIAVPLTKIANITANVIAAVAKWVAANRALVQTVAAVAAGLVVVGSIIGAAGVALIGLGAAISLIGTAIGSIVGVATAVFGALASAVAAVLSPVGLVVAAVVGLGAYIAYSALTATGALTKLGEMFGSLGGTAIEAWGGIVAALSTGDLQAAGEIAFTALEVAWLTLTTTMRQVWQNVSDFVVNVWLSTVESIVQAGAAIYFGIAKYFDLLTTAMMNGFDVAITYIVGSIDRVVDGITGAIELLKQFSGLQSEAETTAKLIVQSEAIKGRAQERGQGLTQRMGERSNALGSRDAERRDTAKQFSTIVAEDFKRRKSSIDSSGLTAAQKRLEDLKASLAEKASAAQEKAAAAQEGAGKVAQGQDAAASAISTTGASSIGTFVSGVANQIRGGGVQEDAAEASKKTADNTEQMLRLMQLDGGLA